jgi:ssDNA-binding replication factor A large subunit
MKIQDLRPKASIDHITVKVVKLLSDRKVRSKHSEKDLWLQEFRVKDDTGEAILVLWEDDCGIVQPEDLVKITKGYVKSSNNGVKLTPGKYGRMEVL